MERFENHSCGLHNTIKIYGANVWAGGRQRNWVSRQIHFFYWPSIFLADVWGGELQWGATYNQLLYVFTPS